MKSLPIINFCCLLLLVMVGCGDAVTTPTAGPVQTVETTPTEPAAITAPEIPPAKETAPEKTPVKEKIQATEKDQPPQQEQAVEKAPLEPDKQKADSKQIPPEVPTVPKQQTEDQPPAKVEPQAADKQPAAAQQQKAAPKPIEQVPQTADPNRTAVVKPPEGEPQPSPEQDENRILVSVNDKQLRAWQANVLLEGELAWDILGVVEAWIKITSKAEEMRRLELDRKRENHFEMEFMQDFHLATTVLTKKIEGEMPEITEEELRQNYEQNITLYVRPMSADLQHITVLQKDLAEQIAAEARKPDASFDDLVAKYGSERLKATQGRLYGASAEFLDEKLGPRAAEAVGKSRPASVIGPIMGREGFEVILVYKVLQARNTSFEQARENIKSTINNDRYQEIMKNIDKELLAKVKVVKSEEILKMEKEREIIKYSPDAQYQ